MDSRRVDAVLLHRGDRPDGRARQACAEARPEGLGGARGDDLYVRSLGGHASDWYRSARIHRKGTVRAAGLRRNVVFEPADPGTRERVDAAYRLKYGHYAAAFLDTVTGDEAASTTLRLVPCTTRTQASACSAAALPAGRGSRIRSPLGPAGRWHALFERPRRQEEKA
ncbi:DUF2255 family protein [Nocardiopsis sp. ARC36]